ncbi:MAG TPA: ABC transporter permease [Candidatus Sulfotelmatobacter sp.]|jgi:lipopolysaccharide transport system permease protein|nr:ABC transporter permease [Candidatus Sulfotelmatobacter sp.]
MSQRLIIEAGRTERQYWRDLWRYRELFYFLAWRDLLVRYKQTAVGVAWSFVRPVLAMAVLTLMMKVSKLPGDGVSPLPLFVFCAMLPWQFFSTAFSESGSSLITNSNLVSKIYFPRLVVPASSIITSFVDFLIASVFTVILMVWYRFLPPVNILFLPVFVLLTLGASLGTGLWIAALMVKYRDFRFIVPFMVQFGLYAAPVFAMTAKIPETHLWHGMEVPVRLIYALNPIVGIIDGFRWCVLGGTNVIYLPGFVASVVGVVVLVWSGLSYFRKTERSFADMI